MLPIVTDAPGAFVMPYQSSRCVEGLVRQLKFTTVPFARAAFRVAGRAPITRPVTPAGDGAVPLIWLNAAQNAVVQVSAPDTQPGAIAPTVDRLTCGPPLTIVAWPAGSFTKPRMVSSSSPPLEV